MKKWLKRLATMLFLLLWLILLSFPIVAFSLAAKGELQIGSTAGKNIRLFMVQEEVQNGVGFAWQRVDKQRDGCFQTTLKYWFWEGKGENISYCQCFDEKGNTVSNLCQDVEQ